MVDIYGSMELISIHALREEGDQAIREQKPLDIDFYPRPPRGGRRKTFVGSEKMMKLFLSTPSARRATYQPAPPYPEEAYFYPRPPRGGRQPYRPPCLPPYPISIHALREEGDSPINSRSQWALISIHALREEGDGDHRLFQLPFKISIHALREEGDSVASTMCFTSVRFLSTPSARRATSLQSTGSVLLLYFYPRPPRGGRRSICHDGCTSLLFLSTPSARRATSDHSKTSNKGVFLSTPSARRATMGMSGTRSQFRDFYPRPPRGGRHRGYLQAIVQTAFLSTPSARRATAKTEKNISTFVSL